MNIYTRLRLAALALAGAASAFFTACGGGEEPASISASSNNAGAQAQALFHTGEPPSMARPIGEIVQSPSVGEEVTVRGQIGGAVDPFGEGYAIFLLADESLLFCDEMEMSCPTPWDACCEDPEKVQANRALVQITDEKGQVLPLSLKDFEGLAPNSKVVVAGKVAEVDQAGNVIIDASGIYRR